MKLLQTWTVDEYYTMLQADIQIKEAELAASKGIHSDPTPEET